MDADELMDAVNQWAAAECVDCGAHFTNQGEAFEHEHEVLHLFVPGPVN